MFRLGYLLFALVIISSPSVAEEWSATSKSQMDAAGSRLKAAKTTAQRVSALREIEMIAAANPKAPGARTLAVLLGQKASMEAGPGIILKSLGDLAASGQIGDTESYVQIISPILGSMADMRKNGTLLPEMAIKANDGIKKLDGALAKAGLPSTKDALSRVIGNDKSGATILSALDYVANLAKLKQGPKELARMDKAAGKKLVDTFMGLFPAGAKTGLGNQLVVVRDIVAWDFEMFGQVTEALGLVKQAINTGELDQEAYERIRNRIIQLARSGPWDSDTAKDLFKNLCKSIPIASAWCDDAFQAAEEIFARVNCSAISCDCGNIGGGLTGGALVVQCKIQEQSLIETCKATKTITGSCARGAKGPGATH